MQHSTAADTAVITASQWLMPLLTVMPLLLQEGSDMESLASSIPPPPQDWLPKVTSPEIRRWAVHLHDTWGLLCREVSES